MKIFGDPGELTENDSVLEVKEKVLHGFSKKKGSNRKDTGVCRRGYLSGRCSQGVQE